jgi:hypothetical protein
MTSLPPFASFLLSFCRSSVFRTAEKLTSTTPAARGILVLELELLELLGLIGKVLVGRLAQVVGDLGGVRMRGGGIGRELGGHVGQLSGRGREGRDEREVIALRKGAKESSESRSKGIEIVR